MQTHAGGVCHIAPYCFASLRFLTLNSWAYTLRDTLFGKFGVAVLGMARSWKKRTSELFFNVRKRYIKVMVKELRLSTVIQIQAGHYSSKVIGVALMYSWSSRLLSWCFRHG
jgi:hypothetical protein